MFPVYKNFICLLFFFLISTLSSLDAQDYEKDLQFISEIEKSSFNNYNNEVAFNLLLSIDNSEPINNQYIKDFYVFLDEIAQKNAKKKPAKRVVALFEAIHEKYFIKYLENPNFCEIFSDKTYNCVTATALYALAFNHLNISYQIKEMPTHVYLVAMPESEKIILEPTMPNEGFTLVNDKQIGAYKDYLVANKLITEEEAVSYNSEKIFSDYILSDENISLENLVGIQYYNNAIKYIETENIPQGLIQAEKAAILYERDYIKDWINIILTSLMDEEIEKLSIQDYCTLLEKYLTINGESKYLQDAIIQNFKVRSYEFINQSNVEKVNELSSCLIETVDSTNVKEEITYIRSIFLAEFYYNSLENDKALSLLAAAYRPEDTRVNMLIKSAVAKKLQTISGSEAAIDSLTFYHNLFSFLKADKEINEFGVFNYMRLVHNNFALGDVDAGNKWLQKFKDAFQPSSPAIFRDEYIGSGFGAASAHYVRENNYYKAEQILNDGLKYMPESLELKRKLKLIKER